jgi:HEAT repeat protein
MESFGAKPLTCLFFAVFLAALTGCADGPVPYLASLNPRLRRQWEADELYRPTLHRQLAEVAALRASARGLTREQQRHWSGEMAHIIETHDHPLLRSEAVTTLAVLSVPESHEGLRIAARDPDSTVRIDACRAWGVKGGQEAMEQLAELLGNDTDVDVRITAARELARFSDPLAYQSLGLALDDDDPALQYRAVESLKTASGKNFGNDLDAWRRFAQGEDPGPEYTPSLAERLREYF